MWDKGQSTQTNDKVSSEAPDWGKIVLGFVAVLVVVLSLYVMFGGGSSSTDTGVVTGRKLRFNEETLLNENGVRFTVNEVYSDGYNYTFHYSVENSTDDTISLTDEYCAVNGVDFAVGINEEVRAGKTNKGSFYITEYDFAYGGITKFSSLELSLIAKNDDFDTICESGSVTLTLGEEVSVGRMQVEDIELFSGAEFQLIYRGVNIERMYDSGVHAPDMTVYFLCKSFLDEDLNVNCSNAYINDESTFCMMFNEVRPYSTALLSMTVLGDEELRADEVLNIEFPISFSTYYGINEIVEVYVDLALNSGGNLVDWESDFEYDDEYSASVATTPNQPQTDIGTAYYPIYYNDPKTGKTREIFELTNGYDTLYSVLLSDYINQHPQFFGEVYNNTFVDIYDTGSSMSVIEFPGGVKNCVGVMTPVTITPVGNDLTDREWYMWIRTPESIYLNPIEYTPGVKQVVECVVEDELIDVLWFTVAPLEMGPNEGFYVNYNTDCLLLFETKQDAADYITDAGM